MARLLCLLNRHAWTDVKTDEAGPYQTCTRCHKVRNSHRLGPGGYEAMPPQVPPAR
jgi:hypothetical protein